MNSILFYNLDSEINSSAPHLFKKVDGILLEYTKIEKGYRLIRVHSPNPSDYLNPELSPGADITYLIL